jgi:hypothetical protein
LLLPAPRPQHAPQRPFAQRLGPIDGFQVEHGLLHVRGEQAEVEQLADAGAGQLEAASDGGSVVERPIVDAALEVDR